MYAAKIVVREISPGVFSAGFASQLKGRTVRTYGKWYGCQMRYRPFKAAMSAAITEAARLSNNFAEVADCFEPRVFTALR